MSRNGSTRQDFGGGEHLFRLGFEQLQELQDLTGYGAERTMLRIQSGDWSVTEVREVLRIGLIGGGCEPSKALALVRRYVENTAEWLTNKNLAFVVLAEALQGVEEDAPGKPEPGDNPTKVHSQTDDGASQNSTKSEQGSD